MCLLLAAVALAIGFGLVTMVRWHKQPTYSLTGGEEVSIEEEEEEGENNRGFDALNCGAQFMGKEVMMLEGV